MCDVSLRSSLLNDFSFSFSFSESLLWNALRVRIKKVCNRAGV